jgi:uncharacterized protein YutE (UPF0331/DUF86 family)
MTDADLIAKKLAFIYQAVDKAVVRDVVENHLDDLDAYVRAIRGRMVGPCA